MDARLPCNVVVLDAVQQARQTPEGVRFDGVQYVCGQPGGVERLGVRVCTPTGELEAPGRMDEGERTNVCGEEDLEEWRHKVVDSLHIPTRGVTDSPDVQYSFQTLLKVSGGRHGWVRLTRCVDACIHSGTPGLVLGTSISIWCHIC